MTTDRPRLLRLIRLLDRLRRIGLVTARVLFFGGFWMVDVGASEGSLRPLFVTTAPLFLLPLFLPRRTLPTPARRAWLALGLSWVVTGMAWARPTPPDAGGWGLLETACLVVLLVPTARRVAPPRLAVALTGLLFLTVLALPWRSGHPTLAFGVTFFLTFVAGAAVGLGCYWRVLDERRRQLVERARYGERLELARDLHDFVAHHVTGIVVQAQAARVVSETAPEQVGPILDNIEKSGVEALASMRQLVRVLREEEAARRPPDGLEQIAGLVEGFQRSGPPTTLQISNAARAARLAPEVATSAHRVVQEALTNVRRHAPDAASVEVSVLARPGGLEVTVRNAPPGEDSGGLLGRAAGVVLGSSPGRAGGPRVPFGGRGGGFGLVGLRERVEAIGGSLHTGPRSDGGWEVVAMLPVVAAGTEPEPARAEPAAHGAPEQPRGETGQAGSRGSSARETGAARATGA
ncbi:sensor histidine kinase [Allostreptomyces psammosilenae]|uniref:histidine kinase n=1 Tax=Allostreptomyces psammosilenae TaxID=1892865 RepID=A0A852ZW97_9ACTN|nr:histidine kinase [Allostreptomyces psammosilenae]NYI05034.1 signal transduction histidine kinase [Allostreptomyces psammosilenae]